MSNINMNNVDANNLERILQLESFIGLVTNGQNDPRGIEFHSDVPPELIKAWEQLYLARTEVHEQLLKAQEVFNARVDNISSD